MLTQIEIDYILSLINTYQKLGYKYYLCNTITDNDILYDMDIYFSRKEIKAVTSTTFDLIDALQIKIDSSNRNNSGYNQSLHSRDNLVNKSLTGIVTIDEAEFIYTNATISTEGSTLVNPDLLLNSADSNNHSLLLGANVLLTGMIFLYIFFAHILRLKK